MGVVGFDIGNENCVIAFGKRGVIDVLLNDESKRETPAVVSFGEKQRFLGSAGAAFATKNPKSTISQIKRLIGRKYKEQSVLEELKLLPFETTESSRGGILIHLQYLNEKKTFMPVEILGMLFAHLKQMTEKNLGSPVVDCVIGIPSYFTDLQRREYLNAASIAGLSPLKLIHDCTAVALGYGIYKTDFSGKGPTNVMFLDIGQCDTQVTIAAFEKGKMTILSHSFDQHLGGRDFDEVLFTYFAKQFKEHDKIDVNSNLRACIRLRTSCEKLKKDLSANAEATLSIECLIDDKDVNGMITRKEFVKLSQELLERVTATCRNAVDHSHLRSDKIHTIELVGSGSRIPAIKRKIAKFFQYKQPVMRTLNGSECVARGCAIDCAMLSLTLRVPDYKVKESFPYSILGHCHDVGENQKRQEVELFPKGSPFPSNGTVLYHGNTSFYCSVFYTNKTDFPSRISPEAARFLIRGPSQTSGAEKVVVKVKVHLNIHGIVEIEYASIIEDKHPPSIKSYPRELVKRFGNYKQNAAAYHNHAGSGSYTEHLEEPRGSCARSQNLQVCENDLILTTIEEVCAAQVKAESFAKQDLKVEKTKEKRNTLESFIYDTRSKIIEDKHPPSIKSYPRELVKRFGNYKQNDAAYHNHAGSGSYTEHLEEPRGSCARSQNLQVCENDLILTTIEEVCAAQVKAESFAKQDLKVEKTKEKRNTLESFIYDTRSKLLSSYRSVATDQQVEIIFESLKKTEDWLYKEGVDESETLYARELDDLTKLLDPIENKYKLVIARKEATEALETCIQENRSAANSLPSSQKKEIDNECVQAEGWLKHVSQLPDSFANIATAAIYWSNVINGITEALTRNCKVILGSSLSKYEEPVDSDQKPNPISPQAAHYQNSAPGQQPSAFLGGVDQPTSLPNIVNTMTPNDPGSDISVMDTTFNTMTPNDPESDICAMDTGATDQVYSNSVSSSSHLM